MSTSKSAPSGSGGCVLMIPDDLDFDSEPMGVGFQLARAFHLGDPGAGIGMGMSSDGRVRRAAWNDPNKKCRVSRMRSECHRTPKNTTRILPGRVHRG